MQSKKGNTYSSKSVKSDILEGAEYLVDSITDSVSKSEPFVEYVAERPSAFFL